jgi:carbonic anhydrase/acetyltransferase-like protein (isoleucine patch superfamily)
MADAGRGLVIPFGGKTPQLAPDVWIAPTAVVTGDLVMGAGCSVWYGAVIRADVHAVRIGEGTNVQDGAVLHVTTGKWPLMIGNRVTIGHRAVLHGCTVEDESLIGMGAIVLDGAVVETGAMVAAGALVSPGKRVTSGWLWAGVPARPVRELTAEEKRYLGWSSTHYTKLAAQYK